MACKCGGVGFVAERWLRLVPSPVCRGEPVVATGGKRDAVVVACLDCETGKQNWMEGVSATHEQREAAVTVRRQRAIQRGWKEWAEG